MDQDLGCPYLRRWPNLEPAGCAARGQGANGSGPSASPEPDAEYLERARALLAAVESEGSTRVGRASAAKGRVGFRQGREAKRASLRARAGLDRAALSASGAH
ncbi:hypothetical protein AXG93_1962s1240 [Marchantia polymorpha subsp. ruderalis]|uniref:Uncharacterized protein n=1 Tax=Marchantia polymorpha subsp. ruderalis TaxID=1480154 RepID=A0A176WDS2_MARPO|nr:hypothetical protein AXG93_1962s1240 [Marchantia polymorpha subsp. ruderalis]